MYQWPKEANGREGLLDPTKNEVELTVEGKFKLEIYRLMQVSGLKFRNLAKPYRKLAVQYGAENKLNRSLTSPK